MNFWIARFVINTPFRIKHWIAWAFAILFFDIFRFRRGIVLSNIDIVFPSLSKAEKLSLARASIYNNCYNFIELLTFPGLSDEWINEELEIEGLEHVEKALAQGKGIYFLSLHLGHGDISALKMSHLGYRIHLITKEFKTRWFNRFWFVHRQRFGTKYIEAHGPKTPFEILKALKASSCVVFVLDQFMGIPFGLETTFFGFKTGTAMGLALFALRTQSPVLPIYHIRLPNGRGRIVILPPVEFENKEDKDQTVLHMTQKYNFVLEDIIRHNPRDWMWIHRRFKPFS